MEHIVNKSIKEIASEGVKRIIETGEQAESIEISIKIDNASIPTISYSINGFPLVYRGGKYDNRRT